MWIDILVFILPFTLLFGGIFGLKKSVLWSGTLATSSAALLLSLVWEMTPQAMLAATAKASLVTVDIVSILIGALILLSILSRAGAITTLKKALTAISPDRRIQSILIGIFFVGFIEGVAGFGTPAMLAAPLLVAIGFPIRAAIVLSLIGDTLSVPFGAVGTPFLIGLEQGIPGTTSLETIPFLLMIGLPLALAAPFFMTSTLTGIFGGNWKEGLHTWKHSLLAGICFVIPYSTIALFMGPEFPAMLGSLIGGIAFILALKHPSLHVVKPWDFGNNTSKTKKITHTSNHISLKKLLPAIGPYTVVVLLLVLSRLNWLPFHSFLSQTMAIHVTTIFNQNITHTIQPFYSPGTFLLIGALSAFFIFTISSQEIKKIMLKTLTKVVKPTITLFILITLAQLLLHSNINISQKPSVPLYAAEIISTLPISWVLLAPFVGLFGSLITGSVTVSNILFASFQTETANLGNYSIPLILALQVLGAAAGNMIALHNVIAVLAAVQTKTKPTQSNTKKTSHSKHPTDRDVLTLLMKPALLYAVGVGCIAYIFTRIWN